MFKELTGRLRKRNERTERLTLYEVVDLLEGLDSSVRGRMECDFEGLRRLTRENIALKDVGEIIRDRFDKTPEENYIRVKSVKIGDQHYLSLAQGKKDKHLELMELNRTPEDTLSLSYTPSKRPNFLYRLSAIYKGMTEKVKTIYPRDLTTESL